jgi:hypothetical protein
VSSRRPTPPLQELFTSSSPVYSVAVIFASGKSCARRFKDTESSVSHARTAHPDLPLLATKPRPSFVPLDYADVVQTTGNLVSTCLDLGGGGTVVTIIDTKGNSRQLNLVTPILQSIAKSAVPHADIISAPRMAKLTKLEVEIPLRDGQWAVTQMPAIGTQQRDTLVRLKRDVPLEISLAEFAPTAASTCSNLFTDSTDEKPQYAHLKRSPAYLGRGIRPHGSNPSLDKLSSSDVSR